MISHQATLHRRGHWLRELVRVNSLVYNSFYSFTRYLGHNGAVHGKSYPDNDPDLVSFSTRSAPCSPIRSAFDWEPNATEWGWRTSSPQGPRGGEGGSPISSGCKQELLISQAGRWLWGLNIGRASVQTFVIDTLGVALLHLCCAAA